MRSMAIPMDHRYDTCWGERDVGLRDAFNDRLWDCLQAMNIGVALPEWIFPTVRSAGKGREGEGRGGEGRGRKKGRKVRVTQHANHPVPVPIHMSTP